MSPSVSLTSFPFLVVSSLVIMLSRLIYSIFSTILFVFIKESHNDSRLHIKFGGSESGSAFCWVFCCF